MAYMNETKKPELLAPAGGMRELKAAIQSGADAVYIGASAFSARSGASNFTKSEMKEAVDYAHFYGAKIHCAVNTLIKERELQDAVDTAVSAAECGVDALIIQDIGLGAYLKNILPDTELHASTQMTVTSYEGVKYLEEMGFSRVVLARELSLDEIRAITSRAKAEIEVFVHGAICMSYSGQCLMSSILGGRSGNRGRCAQPCRLKYELMSEGKSCGDAYILSPKDMSLIDHIEELKNAGVSSFKIEGRLKSAEYVSTVVSVYRKYIDNPRRTEQSDIKRLKDAFSRSGFTDGYLTGRLGADMMSHTNPANNSGSVYTKDAIDCAAGKIIRRVPIDIYASLKEGEPIEVTGCDDLGNCAVVTGTVPSERAKTKPLGEERIKEQLEKLGDTLFSAENTQVYADEGITVPIKEINEVRRRMCDELFRERTKQLQKRVIKNDIDFTYDNSEHDIYLTAQVRTKEQGEAVIKESGVKRIYAPAGVAEYLKKISEGTQIVTITSPIAEDEEIKTDGVCVTSFGASYKYRGKTQYGDWRLNIYNSLTARMFRDMKCITLSPELNFSELKEVCEHIKGVEKEVIAYGRLPLMIMKNCPVKAMGFCQQNRDTYFLKDRKNMEFPIICEEGCRAVILNSKPIYTADITDSFKKIKINCIRLNFTVENSHQCGKIVSVYKNALKTGESEPMGKNEFTRGHLRRGVE